jgi:hypothetical protein
LHSQSQTSSKKTTEEADIQKGLEDMITLKSPEASPPTHFSSPQLGRALQLQQARSLNE